MPLARGQALIAETDLNASESAAWACAAAARRLPLPSRAQGGREGLCQRGPRPGWSSSADTFHGAEAALQVWCIFIYVSLYISHVVFLIYRWGPALPPPCRRHKCPPMGGATVPALYQGVLGRGLPCLEVSKASFLDLSGCAEASLAPAESIAQPPGTGKRCAKASTVASWQQSVTASSRFPVCRSLLPPALSRTCCQLRGPDPGPPLQTAGRLPVAQWDTAQKVPAAASKGSL